MSHENVEDMVLGLMAVACIVGIILGHDGILAAATTALIGFFVTRT